ncbi:peptidase M56 family protein [Anopheles sinensis]|uniref:Peptidase M56 family protein n=1 Tax=Anopheles sinensis TaxID=74873 RepID=A0A084WI19_ANOSI|nr:peptidase M56 family protein [Anopheles sinensis]
MLQSAFRYSTALSFCFAFFARPVDRSLTGYGPWWVEPHPDSGFFVCGATRSEHSEAKARPESQQQTTNLEGKNQTRARVWLTKAHGREGETLGLAGDGFWRSPYSQRPAALIKLMP